MQEFFDRFLKGAPAPEWMEKGIPYLQKEKYRVADGDGPTVQMITALGPISRSRIGRRL